MTLPEKPERVPRVTVAVVDCPECHQICGWCSWYRWQARELGCGCPPYGQRRINCDLAKAVKGTECGTCDGSRTVTVRREIIDRRAMEASHG